MSADPSGMPRSLATNDGRVDAEALTARVAGLDGVTDIFPPAAIVTQVPQLVTALVTSNHEKLNRVDVATSGGVARITARIGTSIDLPTVETAHSVADMLLAGIPDDQPATITVQVSRIS